MTDLASESPEPMDDPGAMSMAWPVLGFRDAGGLSHIHPVCEEPESVGAELVEGRYWDHWDQIHRRLPDDAEWELVPRPGTAAVGLNYLSRFIWLRHLAGAWQLQPSPKFSALACRWLAAFHRHNPAPRGYQFRGPVHSAMNVGHRLCSYLDAWTVGLFSGGSDGDRAWRTILSDLDHWAYAYQQLPKPSDRVGNHYLFEHGMLPLILGVARPRHPVAKALRDSGAEAVRHCIDQTFAPDGGYAERSLPYTVSTIDHLLVLQRFCSANGLDILSDRQAEKLRRAGEFILAMADTSGEIPPLGDGVPENSRGLQVSVGELYPHAAAPPRIACYPDPGVCFLRSGRGPLAAHLTIALCGNSLANYHQHHDVLSLLLSIDGERLIDDHAAHSYNHCHGFRGDPVAGRLIRHYRFSARSHNIPCPRGRNRPTLAEYGTGYWGRGSWRDLDGRRQFWGGRPPGHKALRSHATPDGPAVLEAACSMFPPARHHRRVELRPGALTVEDTVTQAAGNWDVTWHWGLIPERRDGGWVFTTPHTRIVVQCDAQATSRTERDPTLAQFIGDDAGWVTHLPMKRDGATRRLRTTITWTPR